MQKVMTKYEEHHLLKHIVKRFSRDETIVLLNKKLKDAQFYNGVLKSELEELKHKLANPPKHVITNREYKQQVDELIYQLQAFNCPIPSKYQHLITDLTQ